MRNNVKDKATMRKMSPIKVLREKTKMSQAELAVKLGVSPTTLWRWEQTSEKGVEPAMTAEEWLKFCTAVGIAWQDIPDYFVFGKLPSN